MAKTFKVGDKVRAIDNAYGITNKEYGYEKLTNRGGLIAILDDTEAQYE